jgi:hypothetical protein
VASVSREVVQSLIDLEPRWLTSGDNRHGMGVSFRCPHCETRLAVWFENPIDGGASINPANHRGPLWKRSGDSFETLTLATSIDAKERDPDTRAVVTLHWHGFISNGLLLPCN